MSVLALLSRIVSYASQQTQDELDSLIRVEDFRLAETSHWFADRLEEEVVRQRIGKPPGEDPAAGAISRSIWGTEVLPDWICPQLPK